MAKRQLPPTFTLREVQTTARPRATAGTLTATISSSLTDAPTEPERLVKRARSGMGEEGPSGDRKVLSKHPLEYKEDEEESEGEAYLPDQEEEGVEEWPSCYPCLYCGRLDTYAPYAYCCPSCQDRDWDQMQQERDSHYDWYCSRYPFGSLLQGYFE